MSRAISVTRTVDPVLPTVGIHALSRDIHGIEESPTQNQRRCAHEDWDSVINNLLLGDITRQQAALHKLNRLLTGFLIELRAWRYKEHWPDLRQTVLLKLIETLKKHQLRDTKAFVSFARTTTRRAFFDLLNEPATEPADIVEDMFDGSIIGASAMHAAIDRLPDKLKKVVQAVYIMDLPYAAAAQSAGVPLGTLKRHLQQALKQLRIFLNGSRVCDTASTAMAGLVRHRH